MRRDFGTGNGAGIGWPLSRRFEGCKVPPLTQEEPLIKDSPLDRAFGQSRKGCLPCACSAAALPSGTRTILVGEAFDAGYRDEVAPLTYRNAANRNGWIRTPKGYPAKRPGGERSRPCRVRGRVPPLRRCPPPPKEPQG